MNNAARPVHYEKFAGAAPPAIAHGAGFNAPSTAPSTVWLICWIAGLVYGSLLPFTFHGRHGAGPFLAGLASITFAPTSIPDVAINFLLYVPLGVWWRLRSPARQRRFVGWSTAITTALVLSFGIEAMQTMSPQRVASWTDIALNVWGTAIGWLIAAPLNCWAHIVVRSARRACRKSPLEVLAAITIGFLMMDAMATNTRDAASLTIHPQLHSSLAVVVPSAFGSVLAPAGLALLACLLSAARQSSSSKSHPVLLPAFTEASIVAVVLWILAVLTGNGDLSAIGAALTILPILLGVWCGAFFLPRPNDSDATQGNDGMHVLILAALVCFVAAHIIMGATAGHEGASGRLLPFEQLWRMPAHSAASYALQVLVRFGVLAWLLAQLLYGLGVARTGWCIRMAVLGISGVCLLRNAVAQPTAVDVTDTVLAVIAASLVCHFSGRRRKQQSHNSVC